MQRIGVWVIVIMCLVYSVLFAEYVEEDFDFIRQKAEAGDPYYQGVLGEIYYWGEQGEEDYEMALHWLQLSAGQRGSLALFYLGYMCVLGEYMPPESLSCEDLFSQAFLGLKELAEEDNARAQTALGSLYRYGWGVEEDTEKSLMWNTKAAEQGFPRAMYNEGVIYYNGIGVEKDHEKAKFWYEKLAQQGDKRAQFQIANMYYNGHAYAKNIEKALEIFREVQTPNRVYEKMKKEGDYIIPNVPPPKYSLIIEEGSCGECCLWSILQAKGIKATQVEINKAGGDPGRGLHVDELFGVFDKYNVGFDALSTSVNASDCALVAAKYHSFLYDGIIPRVKKGNPVLIGIKIYPTRHPEWAFDHFVLVVGYNDKTDELIYNDFSRRKRIHAEQLVSQPEIGYSFVNEYNWVFAVEFLDFLSN